MTTARELTAAARRGHCKKLRTLLAALDRTGAAAATNDALLEATRHERDEAIDILLAAGANPTTSNSFYCMSPIEYALSRGAIDRFERMRKYAKASAVTKLVATPELLFLAAQAGHLALIRERIDAGHDLETASGRVPLIAAAAGGHEAVVELLLDAGAPIDQRGTTSEAHRAPVMTALLAAAREGHDSVVRLLLVRGADPAPTMDDGSTLLHAAAEGGLAWLVCDRLDAGAAIGARDARGDTPIRLAVTAGRTEAVRVLIERGADVSETKARGYYGLVWVANKLEFPEIAQLLEQAKAPPPAIDRAPKAYSVTSALKDPASLIRLKVPKLTDDLPFAKLVKVRSLRSTASDWFPQLGKLTALERLNLQGCGVLTMKDRLGAVGPEIGRLVNLKDLNLHDNRIERLPDEIVACRKLRILELSGNRLRRLPDDFGELAALITLHLSDNRLERLPESFGKLEELRHLCLNENPIAKLPDSLAGLHSLEELILDPAPHLTAIPETFVPRSLRELRLDCPKLKRIPEAWCEGGLPNLALVALDCPLVPAAQIAALRRAASAPRKPTRKRAARARATT